MQNSMRAHWPSCAPCHAHCTAGQPRPCHVGACDAWTCLVPGAEGMPDGLVTPGGSGPERASLTGSLAERTRRSAWGHACCWWCIGQFDQACSALQCEQWQVACNLHGVWHGHSQEAEAVRGDRWCWEGTTGRGLSTGMALAPLQRPRRPVLDGLDASSHAYRAAPKTMRSGSDGMWEHPQGEPSAAHKAEDALPKGWQTSVQDTEHGNTRSGSRTSLQQVGLHRAAQGVGQGARRQRQQLQAERGGHGLPQALGQHPARLAWHAPAGLQCGLVLWVLPDQTSAPSTCCWASLWRAVCHSLSRQGMPAGCMVGRDADSSRGRGQGSQRPGQHGTPPGGGARCQTAATTAGASTGLLAAQRPAPPG